MVKTGTAFPSRDARTQHDNVREETGGTGHETLESPLISRRSIVLLALWALKKKKPSNREEGGKKVVPTERRLPTGPRLRGLLCKGGRSVTPRAGGRGYVKGRKRFSTTTKFRKKRPPQVKKGGSVRMPGKRGAQGKGEKDVPCPLRQRLFDLTGRALLRRERKAFCGR